MIEIREMSGDEKQVKLAKPSSHSTVHEELMYCNLTVLSTEVIKRLHITFHLHW